MVALRDSETQVRPNPVIPARAADKPRGFIVELCEIRAASSVFSNSADILLVSTP